MDDTQRNLVGGAGIALGPAAIAWATLFPSGSWVVRVLPAVAMAVVGTALFLVAYRGRTGGMGRWFKRKKKIDQAAALRAQERQERVDRLKEILNERYQEGQKLLQVAPEMGFADRAEFWRALTHVVLRISLGEMTAVLFSSPLEIIPGIEIDPKDAHRLRLNELYRVINDPRLPSRIQETWQPKWESDKQVTTQADDV